jgi:hypothetical protein
MVSLMSRAICRSSIGEKGVDFIFSPLCAGAAPRIQFDPFFWKTAPSVGATFRQRKCPLGSLKERGLLPT